MPGAGLLSGPGVGPWTLKVVPGILACRPPLGKGGPERSLKVWEWGCPGASLGRLAALGVAVWLDQGGGHRAFHDGPTVAGTRPYGVTLTLLDRWPTPASLIAFTRYM